MKTYLSALVGVTLLFTSSSVYGAERLASPLPVKSSSSNSELSITLTDDILPGETSSRTYTYTMLADEKASSSKFLTLDWSHSELLIPPSALTIKIDGNPLESIALSKDTVDGNAKVFLRSEHLTKGTHEVTIDFTGILQGRMCDNGNTTGSWLTIRPSSFLSIGNETSSLSLNDYPSPFTQTFNEKLTIVLPDQPDMSSLEAGLLMYRQLKNDASTAENVSLQYERQMKTIDGRYIFVGTPKSFTGNVNKLINELKPSFEPNQVLLERANIVGDKNRVDALFVLAEDAAAFEGTLDHLLIDGQRQQLSGEKLYLSSHPSKDTGAQKVSLQSLGAPDLYLSGKEATSPNYFYPLPVLDSTSMVELDLQFKMSSNVQNSDEGKNPAELIAWINNVPHSVPLDADVKENGWQHQKIKVDAQTLERATFLDVSFEANGFRSESPCMNNDLDRWLYISNESQVQLPTNNGEARNDAFLNVSNLFEVDKGVVIVIPDTLDATALQNVSTVMSELPVTPSTDQITIVQASTLDEKMLNDRSVIFIGDPETTPVLKDSKKKWLVTKDDTVNLNQYGFIPETTSEYAWIQPSIWSKNHAMVVISTTDKIDSSLIQTLVFPNETFNVAVKNTNGAVFTNSSMFESSTSEALADSIDQTTPSRSLWYFGGFLLLIISIAGVLFVLRRKSK